MIEISTIPARVLVERATHAQLLNFDFWLLNATAQTLRLQRIEMSVLDAQERLMLRKFVAPQSPCCLGISDSGRVDIESGGDLFLYNPFYALPADLTIAALVYEFTLGAAGPEIVARTTVCPSYYEHKADLVLPLRGRFIVYDGHDFYSHHRRTDLGDPGAIQLGVKGNPVRYACDFCPVDAQGALYRGAGRHNEEWLGYGAPVYAPGDGRVLVACNDVVDNIMGVTSFDPRQLFTNPMSMMGNGMIIDHGSGEYSGLSHLKQGSVLVRAGDWVCQGQPLGQIGFSGDSSSDVHLHYNLTSGTEIFNSEGLPAYFSRFRRVLGSQTQYVRRGAVDTGDILETLD